MRKVLFLAVWTFSGLVSFPAFAALQVSLFAPNSSVVTIADGGSGDADGLHNDSIVVLNQAVGGYSFSMTAVTTSITGLMAFEDMSILSVTGTLDGKAGIVVSRNNVQSVGGGPLVTQSRTSVSYAAGAVNSQAAVSYATYLDVTNALSVPIYVSGVLTVSPGGKLMESVSGNISVPLGGPTSGWVASGRGHLRGSGGLHAMNLLVMADLSRINALNAANHSTKLNASFRVHVVPEPASMAVWVAGGLFAVAVCRRRR